MNKSTLYWTCQVIGWGTYGCLEVILYFAANGFDLSKVVGEIFMVTFYIVSSHILRYLILRLGLLEFRWFQVIPRLWGLIGALAVVNYFFLVAVSFSTSDFLPSQELNIVSFVVNFAVSSALYFVWSLVYLSFLYVERYNKSLQYEMAAREIELQNLKSQLNPHFIFNALNSIRALIDENPPRSKNAITQLSNILRNSLRTDSKRLVPFKEEMATVMDYLELESIRYEERLKTKVHLHPDSEDFQLPPLMIQTLVENGIKHGIANLTAGGTIDIRTDVVNDTLRIEIRNSGQYHNGVKLDVGYGLLNTKKRLDLLYGRESYFHITNEDNETVLTTVEVPRNSMSKTVNQRI